MIIKSEETKIRVLNETLSQQYDRNPIETIKTRLKNPRDLFFSGGCLFDRALSIAAG